MTPKEKAMKIAMEFDRNGQTDNAVKCALICVDEIIESGIWNLRNLEYWKEVKQEINKL